VRYTRPYVEFLEGRELLTVAAISTIQQYGIPSVVAIDGSGNVSYNYVTGVSGGTLDWSGWNAVPGGVDATAVSTGTVLVGTVTRPYIFVLNTAGDVFFNYQFNLGDWVGWTQVGASVGATAISSGVLPVANQPYVVAIDSSKNIDISYMNANGSWSGWSTVAADAGATAISTGFLQASTSPAIYEPYVIELDSSSHVEYAQSNTSRTWSTLSPVGNDLTATAISALSLGNSPQVFAVTASGSVYSNTGNLTDPAGSIASSRTQAAVNTRSLLRTGNKQRHEPATAKSNHKISVRVLQHPKSHVRARTSRSEPATSASTSVAWAGWSLVGAGPNATPAAATSSVVAVATNYIFAINGAGQPYSTFGTAGLWSHWSSLGSLAAGVTATAIAGIGPPAGSSFGASTPNSIGGLPVAIAIGTDGNVYWVGQTGWATWGTWANLGAPS
jgi:hypothetical protein